MAHACPLLLLLLLVLLPPWHAEAQGESLVCQQGYFMSTPGSERVLSPQPHTLLASGLLDSYLLLFEQNQDGSLQVTRRLVDLGEDPRVVTVGVDPHVAQDMDTSSGCAAHVAPHARLFSVWCGPRVLQLNVDWMTPTRDLTLRSSESAAQDVWAVCAAETRFVTARGTIYQVAFISLYDVAGSASDYELSARNVAGDEASAVFSFPGHSARGNVTLLCSDAWNDSQPLQAAVVQHGSASEPASVRVFTWRDEPISIRAYSDMLSLPSPTLPGAYMLDPSSYSLYAWSRALPVAVLRLRLLHNGVFDAAFSASCAQAVVSSQIRVPSIDALTVLPGVPGEQMWRVSVSTSGFESQAVVPLLRPDLHCSDGYPGTPVSRSAAWYGALAAPPLLAAQDTTRMRAILLHRKLPTVDPDLLGVSLATYSCSYGCGMTNGTRDGTHVCEACQLGQFFESRRILSRPEQLSDTVCATCPAGTRVARPDALGSVRVLSCLPCASGTRNPDPGASVCTTDACDEAPNACPIGAAVASEAPPASMPGGLMLGADVTYPDSVCVHGNPVFVLVITLAVLVGVAGVARLEAARQGKLALGSHAADARVASLDWFALLRHSNDQRFLAGVGTLVVMLACIASLAAAACEAASPASESIHPGLSRAGSNVMAPLTGQLLLYQYRDGNGTDCRMLVPELYVNEAAVAPERVWKSDALRHPGACTLDFHVPATEFLGRVATLRIRLPDAWVSAVQLRTTLAVLRTVLPVGVHGATQRSRGGNGDLDEEIDTLGEVIVSQRAQAGNVLRGGLLHRTVNLVEVERVGFELSVPVHSYQMTHISTNDQLTEISSSKDLFASDPGGPFGYDAPATQIGVQLDLALAAYRMQAHAAQAMTLEDFAATAVGLAMFYAVLWLFVSPGLRALHQRMLANSTREQHTELDDEAEDGEEEA